MERLAGSNRYGTSAAVAAQYPAGVSVAFLANGSDFPDALSASAAAGAQDSPVLLTRAGSIPTQVAAQLDRLDPTRIVVLGGTDAVSNAVLAQAQAYATDVTRIGGADRYETSANVAAEFFTAPVAHAAGQHPGTDPGGDHRPARAEADDRRWVHRGALAVQQQLEALVYP